MEYVILDWITINLGNTVSDNGAFAVRFCNRPLVLFEQYYLIFFKMIRHSHDYGSLIDILQ